MPKSSFYQNAAPDGTQDRRIEVGWQRDGGVQVGVTALAPGADPEREYIDVPDGEPPKPAWLGEFIHLDRSQINSVIRALRQARDHAFGRDE